MLINEGTWSDFRLPRTVVEVVSLERSRLAILAPRIDVTSSHYHIPRTAPGVPLFAGYADLLRKDPPKGDRARQVAASHLHDLVALVLDGFVKGGAARNERSISAARLKLVKRDILDRLHDSGLSIDSVARRQGVTPRYIQRLFEAEGLTFSEFLRDNRLDLALRLLSDPDLRDTTVSAIAYDAGFHDLSNFNRVFRRRYGVTPSEIRADALRKRGR
jgi:AraC-like DNA-binding protein